MDRTWEQKQMIVFIWRLVVVIRGKMVWTTLDLRGERRDVRYA